MTDTTNLREKTARQPVGAWLGLLALAVAALAARAPAQEKLSGALTLDDCIAQAVRRNLGVAAQVFSFRQADLGVAKAGEKFMPTMTFDASRQSTNSASFSWIQSSDVLSSRTSDYSAGLSQNIPFGGRLSASLGAGSYNSNTRFQTINPRYDGTLSFSFSQPLLKDFGWGISRREILVARNDREIAENDLRATLLDTVYFVEQAYWELVYRIESLKVQRQSLKLAEDLLDKSRKEVAIGTLAPKEVISAEAEVASRKADILQAELFVRDGVDSLRGLLNAPLDKEEAEIAPADTPAFVKREVSLEEALAEALKNRPDLQSSALTAKNRELDYSYAKNQNLPAFDLTANYWSPGLSGDRILYLDDNPLTGVIVGRVPGGSTAALRDALGFKYKNWSVALSLQIPLSGLLTRSAVAQAKAGLDRQLALMKQTEQAAYLEVRAAVRAVQTDYERVGARKAASDLAQQKLEAEESKLKVGLSDNFKVLQYQRDLAAARTAELRALVDYTLALGQLDKATGTSLERRNIRLTDAAAR